MLLTPSKNSDLTKRSLILAGGGMRVAYQAGVLKALEEEGLSFHHVDGTSGGTINTAMLFSGISPDDMCQRWSTLDAKDFVSLMPISGYANPLKMKAMVDADGIIDKVFPHLGIELAKLNQPQESIATFNVCNFSTKQNLSISHREVTLKHLVAGISLPIFMPSIKINNDWYTDSVWIKDANLLEAVKRGAEELWLVWCIGNSHEYKEGAFQQYVHMIELSANGALLEEYESIKVLNQRIKNGDSPYGQKKPIKLHVIKPDYPIPLDPDFYLGCINGYELVDMGYQNTKQYLSNRAEDGVDLHWRATAMEEPGVTLITRQLHKTKTKNQGLELELRLRGEAYNVSASTFFQDQQKLTIFADISIDSMSKNQSASSGALWLGGLPDSASGLDISVNTEHIRLKIEGDISHCPLWKMLLGKSAAINLDIRKNGEPFDRAVIKLSLFNLLCIYSKIQVKGADGMLQRIKLKWRLLNRLFN